MAQLAFDATTVAPQQSFTPVPAGVYTATIVDSEVKQTRAGSGQMAVFTMQIVDGEFRGRKLFARINIANANPEAERIGQSQLSALCRATGVLQLQDTVQVHGKTLRVRVKVRKDETGQYGDSNDVTGYEALTGAPVVPGVTPPAAAPAAPAAAATPPWKRAAA